MQHICDDLVAYRRAVGLGRRGDAAAHGRHGNGIGRGGRRR